MPHKINKMFAYARMIQLCSMARKAEEKASWLQGDVKKQALENAKYFKELADEISELI